MTAPADERARLRAAAEELESARGAYWNGKRSREKELAYTRAVDAFQAAANDDAVLRLLDDVATAEQERDACRRSSENRWNTAAELTRALNAERARAERLEAGMRAVEALINESRGVVGLHLNGDEAPWSELRSGGQFEGWLKDFDAALADPAPDADQAEGGA